MRDSRHRAAGPVVVEAEPAEEVHDDYGGHWASRADWDLDDPRWPTTCDHCGQSLPSQARRQTNTDPLYRTPDGRLVTWQEAPDGSLREAWWLIWKGPDGRSIQAKCPGGGEWNIDGQASNCTYRGQPYARDYNPDPASGPEHHRCWVREGSPPGPITVSKGGHTCAAGAGSIVAGQHHGFLARWRDRSVSYPQLATRA